MTVSGPGRIRYFDDFLGGEIPVASAVAYAGDVRGYKMGSMRVTGDLVRTDCGVTSVINGLGGVARVESSASADGDGCAIGTEVMFDVVLMGPLVLEARVQRAVTTAGNIFVGFAGLNADDVAATLTGSGTTLTLTDGNIAGFHYDSSLTASVDWHMPFNGGGTSGPTDSQVVVSGNSNARNVNNESVESLVAGEYDILKVEIDPNATVRWYINGVLHQEQADAVSTTVDLCALVGIWSTTTTIATMDIDYILIEANRDWTV